MDLVKFVKEKTKEYLVDGIMAVMVVEEHNDRSVELARIKTCRGFKDVPPCPNYSKNYDQCKICKCVIAAKSKSLTNRNPKKWGRVELTHCPEGRWGDKDVADYYAD